MQSSEALIERYAEEVRREVEAYLTGLDSNKREVKWSRLNDPAVRPSYNCEKHSIAGAELLIAAHMDARVQWGGVTFGHQVIFSGGPADWHQWIWVPKTLAIIDFTIGYYLAARKINSYSPIQEYCPYRSDRGRASGLKFTAALERRWVNDAWTDFQPI